MGASTSIIVFSCLRMAAPSLMIFSAASSSRRPSFTKWLFKTSSLGFPSSNTSFRVSRCVGGNGTAGNGSGEVSNTSLCGGGEEKKKKNYSLFSRRLSFQASRRAYTRQHAFTEIMLSNTAEEKLCCQSNRIHPSACLKSHRTQTKCHMHPQKMRAKLSPDSVGTAAAAVLH